MHYSSSVLLTSVHLLASIGYLSRPCGCLPTHLGSMSRRTILVNLFHDVFLANNCLRKHHHYWIFRCRGLVSCLVSRTHIRSGFYRARQRFLFRVLIHLQIHHFMLICRYITFYHYHFDIRWSIHLDMYDQTNIQILRGHVMYYFLIDLRILSHLLIQFCICLIYLYLFCYSKISTYLLVLVFL